MSPGSPTSDRPSLQVHGYLLWVWFLFFPRCLLLQASLALNSISSTSASQEVGYSVHHCPCSGFWFVCGFFFPLNFAGVKLLQLETRCSCGRQLQAPIVVEDLQCPPFLSLPVRGLKLRSLLVYCTTKLCSHCRVKGLAKETTLALRPEPVKEILQP